MDARHFEIFMSDLIKNTDFSSGSQDARGRVYDKITAALARVREEELCDEDLGAVAGGSGDREVDSNDHI